MGAGMKELLFRTLSGLPRRLLACEKSKTSLISCYISAFPVYSVTMELVSQKTSNYKPDLPDITELYI